LASVLLARVVGRVVRRIASASKRSAYYGALATRATYAAIIGFMAWQAWFAVFPDDKFFLAEFEEASARAAPQGAKVLARYAGYPDFHGDYCSFSRMETDRLTYDVLLAQLGADSRFTASNGTSMSSEYGGQTLVPLPIAHSFARNDVKPNHHYTIDFLGSGQHIETRICIT
jgi:hypothetical protein